MPGGRGAGKIVGIAIEAGLDRVIRRAERIGAREAGQAATREAGQAATREAGQAASRRAGQAATREAGQPRVPRSRRPGTPQNRPPRGTRPSDPDGYFRPGPYAEDSIPARSKSQTFTPDEKRQVNEIGDRAGCHTCGAEKSGRASGSWTPDHQPVSSQVPDGTPQRLYPHCAGCSSRQGGHAGARSRRRK